MINVIYALLWENEIKQNNFDVLNQIQKYINGEINVNKI